MKAALPQEAGVPSDRPKGLHEPQITARIVYHCNECDPFGPLFGDKSGTHRRKVVFESAPCSCSGPVMCEQCWDTHGPYQACSLHCGCHGKTSLPDQAASNALDRLRGDSAIDRLTADLGRDAQDATRRLRGVLALCGRGLTEAEAAAVRSQLLAELLSLLIKANDAIGQDWSDVIAARQVFN